MSNRLRDRSFLDVQVTFPDPDGFRYRITTQKGKSATPTELADELENTARLIRKSLAQREREAAERLAERDRAEG